MIPVRIDPRPWEQLGSHLLRVAGLLQCPPRDILLAAGTAAPTAALRGLSGFLTDEAARALADLLGVEPDVVHDMTLARFTTGLCGFEHRRGTAGAPTDAPAMLAGGTYCPVCIRHEYWDLRWKTGLSAVCVTHRRYLLARCPVCRQGVAPDSVWPDEDGDTSGLWHGTSAASACEHATDTLGDRPTVRALYAQERVNRLLDAAVGDTDAAATCRDLLRWLEYLHRAVSNRPYLAGNFVSLDGPQFGELLADALDLVNADAPATHPILLRAVQQQRARGRGPHPAPIYAPLDDTRPDTVAEAIRAACTVERAPLVIPGPGAASSGMPQVVPISEFTPELSDPLHQLGYDRARMIAALSIAAPAGTPTWSRIGATLRLAPHVARAAGPVLEHVRDSGQDQTYWDAVAYVRTAVLARGVDFTRRAHAVEHDPRILDAATARWPALADLPTVAVRQWLLDRWACQYVQTIPATVVARTYKAPDYRDIVDTAVGDRAEIASLWSTWEPFAGEGAEDVAA